MSIQFENAIEQPVDCNKEKQTKEDKTYRKDLPRSIRKNKKEMSLIESVDLKTRQALDSVDDLIDKFKTFRENLKKRLIDIYHLLYNISLEPFALRIL